MLQGHGDDIYQYPEIRMNFSSNIYAHAEMSELKAHLCQHIHLIDNYPEPSPRSLERLIAGKYGIPSDSVLVTNGATDAIYLIAQTLAARPSGQDHRWKETLGHGESGHLSLCTHFCTGPQPTFSEYSDASFLHGLRELRWPSSSPCSPKSSGSPTKPILPIKPIEPTKPIPPTPSHTLLWLCNPNNPTGLTYTPSEITDLACRYAYVVVDQSYEDLTLAPTMSHAEAAASPNIIQIHSLTKTYAIPGLRIGYIIASPPIIAALRRLVKPWSVNALAIEAGRWLMTHELRAVPDLPSYLEETQRLRHQLNLIPGIEAATTHTNFILARVTTITAARLKDELASHHHILIRDASNFQGLSPHHFRVSTQTPKENDLLVMAIGAVIRAAIEK